MHLMRLTLISERKLINFNTIIKWRCYNSNLNYNHMNVQHKCLFHTNNAIVKFCENRQCTLPLCLQCQSIHLQEHNSQQSEAKVLRFNEAALKAVNNMQDYLEGFKKFQREAENKIENDREIVMKMVEEYYSVARRMIQQIKANVGKVTENLNKLKKGSIKAMIFYYSGDVKLNSFDLQFQPLQIKIRNVLQQRQDKMQNEAKRTETNAYFVPHQVYNQGIEQKFTHRPIEAAIEKQRTVSMRSVDHETQNIFSNIQQIKEDRNQTRARKSIFEQNRKNSNVSQNNQNHTEMEARYTYQPRFQNQATQKVMIEPNQKFNYEVNYQYKNYQKPVQEPEILSFQNRFLNKFTCAEPTERRDPVTVMTSKEVLRPQAKYEEVYSKKILKPEDLEIQKENTMTGTIPAQISQHLTQRNRSLSQNNITEKEVRKTNYDYDLKRQVLSPEQIRKMLEKKIQERNRVLSIKKSQNYPNIVQERGQKWETRGSIINQIYSEPKY